VEPGGTGKCLNARAAAATASARFAPATAGLRIAVEMRAVDCDCGARCRACPRSSPGWNSAAGCAAPPIRPARRLRQQGQHLVLQSGSRSRSAPTGKGDPYLKGVLGSAAAAAARTDTFLGHRHRRLARRRGKLKALVAVARSILVIVWHLLSDRAARYHDLGADYYASKIDKHRKARSHIRQLEALGYTVALTPAA
jgi:hypothetical protein